MKRIFSTAMLALMLAASTWVAASTTPIIDARTFGVKCDNATNDSTAITNAITAANATGAILQFPSGTCVIATTLVFKNNVIYAGAGKHGAGGKGTTLHYTGTSDAVQINNPINSSTSANITIRDLRINCNTRTAGKAGLADVGSSYLTISRVAFTGCDYGLILDQSELAVVEQSEFSANSPQTAGIWIANYADHSGGASPFFTNRITIRESQFNGTGSIGIADDGGAMHVIRDNNFSVLAKHIRVAATIGLLIVGNFAEQFTTTSIDFAATRLNGTAVIASTEASIQSNYFSQSAALPMLTFAASSLAYMEIASNHFNNTNAGGTIVSGATNVTRWNGSNNQQVGTGASADTTFVNTYNVSSATALAWHADAVDPAIGNGTLTGGYERNGNQVTVHVTMIAGNTTTFGTGQWYFTLPFAMASAVEAHGSAILLDSSAGTFFSGIAHIVPGSPTKVYVSTNNSAADVGTAVPYVWANLDQLRLSITYQITKGSN